MSREIRGLKLALQGAGTHAPRRGGACCAPTSTVAGFTLIEVLVALTIGAIVVLLAHELFGAVADRGRTLTVARAALDRSANARLAGHGGLAFPVADLPFRFGVARGALVPGGDNVCDDRSEEQDLRCVIDPHQDQHKRPGRPKRRGQVRLGR